jgi:hypothetical protein
MKYYLLLALWLVFASCKKKGFVGTPVNASNYQLILNADSSAAGVVNQSASQVALLDMSMECFPVNMYILSVSSYRDDSLRYVHPHDTTWFLINTFTSNEYGLSGNCPGIPTLLKGIDSLIIIQAYLQDSASLARDPLNSIGEPMYSIPSAELQLFAR